MHHPPSGAGRQMWIGLFAAALMAGGVILALRALAFDTDMHERYRSAISLSQTALETLHASADLRTWQAHNAAQLARSGDVPISAAELDDLSARTAELRGRLDRLAAIDMPERKQGQHQPVAVQPAAARADQPADFGQPARADDDQRDRQDDDQLEGTDLEWHR